MDNLHIRLKSQSTRVMRKALNQLINTPDPTFVPEILDLIDHPHDKTRWAAEEALATCADESSIDLLLPLLEIDTGFKRVKAIRVLATLQDPRILPTFVNLLETSNDSYTLSSVAEALGEIGDKAVVLVLIEFVESGRGNYAVRDAITALGRIGDRTAIPKRMEWMQGDCAVCAAQALVQIGDNSVIPELIGMLREKPTWAVLLALDALGDSSVLADFKAALPRVHDDVPKLHRLLPILAHHGDDSVIPLLLPYLDDERTLNGHWYNQRTYNVARQSIERIGSAEGRRVLVQWNKQNTLHRLRRYLLEQYVAFHKYASDYDGFAMVLLTYCVFGLVIMPLAIYFVGTWWVTLGSILLYVVGFVLIIRLDPHSGMG